MKSIIKNVQSLKIVMATSTWLYIGGKTAKNGHFGELVYPALNKIFILFNLVCI